ncbi:F-box-like protein [Rhizoctonia solani AG-3 Rhs1AP]|uniref:F-box-like protein n=2 Tax=Rhizoctonia solani AG-3 TaxID=1086053 RepID=A0A074S9Z1_9AGAM|nr:F-box-like protein [Rhizoctonia solani AG-3 Rhs1AP]KEP46827.1 F-box-like protein [Rhizoctonia solani 123E]
MTHIPAFSHLTDQNSTIASTLLERSVHNSRQPINKLPDELLVDIFLIVEEPTRSIRKEAELESRRERREHRYTPFQDVVVQVSSQWRHAAITSPVLWSYIHITDTHSRDIAQLWASRAGRETLFDIHIELLRPYCVSVPCGIVDWERQEEQVMLTFECLSRHGAGPQRWKSLSFFALHPEPLYVLTGLLNQEPAPELQQLQLFVDGAMDSETDYQEVRGWTEAHGGEGYSLSEHATPNLAHVEFERVSWKYLFDRPKPLLSGLSTLKLLGGFEFPATLPKLHQLFSANPRLELLELNVGNTPLDTFDSLRGDLHLILNPAHLPLLKKLSLKCNYDITWAWGIISVIRAPLLETLSLAGCGNSQADMTDAELFDHVTSNMFLGNDSRSNIPANSLVFPLLRELDVSELILLKEDKIAQLIASFPFIVCLFIPCLKAVKILNGLPHTLSRLETLSLLCYWDRPHDCVQNVGGLVSSWEQNGCPVQVERLSPPRLHLPK